MKSYRKSYKGFNPKNLSPEFWYYLNKDSIELYHEVRFEGEFKRVDSIKIPLRGLLNALKRGK